MKARAAAVVAILVGCGGGTDEESAGTTVLPAGTGGAGVQATGGTAGASVGGGSAGKAGSSTAGKGGSSTAGSGGSSTAGSGGSASGGKGGASTAGTGGSAAGKAGSSSAGAGGSSAGTAGSGGSGGACAKPAVACSKLGAQTLGEAGPFADFLSACPRVAKWVAGNPPPWSDIAKYKCQCGGKTVLRMYGPPGTYKDGQALWDARYASLDAATPEQKASIDYLEGDNEFDAGHGFNGPDGQPSDTAAADYAAFESSFVDVATKKGYRPLVGNIAVGNPAGDVGTCTGNGSLAFAKLVPAIALAGKAGGGWAYHAYTPMWSEDAAGFQSYYALRYRRYLQCFPEIASVPLVLTEGGFDKGGNPDQDGYLQNGGAAQYFPWLSWFDGELKKDASVVGVTLFAFAPAGQWSSFRLDGDVGMMKAAIGAPTCSP